MLKGRGGSMSAYGSQDLDEGETCYCFPSQGGPNQAVETVPERSTR